jgi:hypothetical protein
MRRRIHSNDAADSFSPASPGAWRWPHPAGSSFTLPVGRGRHVCQKWRILSLPPDSSEMLA